jgi:L-rhamnose isomerase
VVGFRNFQKALLMALLEPSEELKKLQDSCRMTELMVRQEEIKTLPFGDVWAQYCIECGAPCDGEWFDEIIKYEENVLSKRA